MPVAHFLDENIDMLYGYESYTTAWLRIYQKKTITAKIKRSRK
jgi:hypothetical protein